MDQQTKTEYPLIRFLLKHKNLNIPVFVFLVIASVIVVFFVMDLQYTADISILPPAASFSQGLAGKLGSLGKLAGIDLGGATAQSQEMYMGILNSRRLLEKVIYYEYEIEIDDDPVKKNLIELFEIQGDNEVDSFEKMIKRLREDVMFFNLDDENNILYLSITTIYPQLSAQIANLEIEILNDIVKNEVQKEYRQQLSYLETRIREAEDSLKIAENNLKKFLETNADPTVPRFQIEQLRLKRNLEIQTEIYIEFRKQLEIFIVDNMINLSDIKILDKAEPPYRKSRPKRLLLLITYVMLAGFMQLGVNASILIYRNFSERVSGFKADV